MKKLLLLLLLCNALLSQAQTSGDYRSAATGNWNVAATWERFDGSAWQPAAAVPSSTDGTVTIRSPHTVTINSSVTADQIIIDAGGTLSDIASLMLTDGTGIDLICNGTFLLSNMLNGAGSAQINATMTWSAGTMTAPLTIDPTGTLNLITTNVKTLSGILTNAGTITWSGGSLTLNNGTLANSGTLNNSFDGTLSSSGGTNVFTNSGTFSKTGGTGITYFFLNCTNSGTLNVNTGTIYNGSTFTNSGTLNVNTGIFNNSATFTNTGTMNIPAVSTFSNNGTLNLNTGTVFNATGTIQMNGTENINVALNLDPAVILSKTNGNTAGTGLTTINGGMSWTGGTLGSPFTVAAGATLNVSTTTTKNLNNTLTNAGTIAWSGGSLTLNNGTLANSGTLNNSFDGTLSSSGGTNVFTNSGTFSKTGGTGITYFFLNCTNSGTFKGVGTLTFASTFTNNGTIAPGLSPGIITVTSSSSPVFNTNSNLEIELLDGSGPGTGHDQLRTGSVTLNGNLTLTELGTIPAGTYTIISSTGTLTGTFSSITQPGGYTVIYNSNSVVVTRSAILPVKLVVFTAISQAAGIELKWQTAAEQNTKQYIVERSADGVAFVEIGTVSAAGNSNTARSYSFTDRQPFQNVGYYRLKSLDNDGVFEYSKIVEVSNKAAVTALSVYPNPVTDKLMITGLKQGEHHTIQLIDANGRMVLRTKTANAQLSIDMSTRMDGSYWVKIITAEEAVIYKIIKQ